MLVVRTCFDNKLLSYWWYYFFLTIWQVLHDIQIWYVEILQCIWHLMGEICHHIVLIKGVCLKVENTCTFRTFTALAIYTIFSCWPYCGRSWFIRFLFRTEFICCGCWFRYDISTECWTGMAHGCILVMLFKPSFIESARTTCLYCTKNGKRFWWPFCCHHSI